MKGTFQSYAKTGCLYRRAVLGFLRTPSTTLKDCHDLKNLMLRHDIEGYYCSIALGLRPPTPSSPSMPLITEWPPRKPFSTLCPYPPHPSVPSHHCLLQEACQDNPHLTPFSGLPWHRPQGYFCPSCLPYAALLCCSHLLLVLSLRRAKTWGLLCMLPSCPKASPSLVRWGVRCPQEG